MTTFARTLHEPATARALHEALPGSRLVGEPGRSVSRIGSLASTQTDVLAFCDAAGTDRRLDRTAACVVLVHPGAASHQHGDKTLIETADVRAAFIDIAARWLPGADRPRDPGPGVDAAATIDATASVAASACIGAGVVIGARTRVAPGAVIYDDCEIGSDCVIGPNAVVGWVGLSYHDRADGSRSFFPHLAGVRIGDRVDIGAQACVCRGLLSHTVIGDDARIGSLVYVSHGVEVGERAWLSAGTSIAGHATIGARALLGIGSIVIDNVLLEPGVVSGAGSVVTRAAAAGTSVQGVPAHTVKTMRRFGPTPRD